MNRHNQNLSSGAGKRRSRGVTLVELLITVAIVAIIAAVAIPSYNTYVLRTHRTEAKSALLNMASMEERLYSTTNQYTTNATQLGYAAASPVIGSGYYQVNISNVNPATATTQATYTLTATPVAGGMQVADTACTAFSLDQSGTQAATGSPTATVDCWK
jgi:type IV pilus assembly protein PilE